MMQTQRPHETRRSHENASRIMDHVPSVPVDLRAMELPAMSVRSMQRTEGNMRLNAAGLDESQSKISESADDQGESLHREISDETNTSELAQDPDLLIELLEEKEGEVADLQAELKRTQECFEELSSNLSKAQMIISEQQEQLAIYRQVAATSKTNIEALKQRNYILASASSERTKEVQDVLDEFREMQEELERLRHNKKDSEVEINKLIKELIDLRKQAQERLVYHEQSSGDGVAVSQAVANQNRISQSTTSLESADLIRQLRAEKTHWENYANRLVRAMVEHSPAVLEVAQDSLDTDSPLTERERRWHDYALRLLQDNVRADPSRLQEIDRVLLHPNGGAAVMNGTDFAVDAGTLPDRETKATSAQTRRRKIDRLKDFFGRRRTP